MVERFRASGLDVELQRPQRLPVVPVGVDISAYRIIQEALTNALKHGADRTAAVSLAVSSRAVSIHASNPSSGARGSGANLGLPGMAERVALLGGSLSHGVDEMGQFVVSASLPLTTGESR